MKRRAIVLTFIALTVAELVRRAMYWPYFGWGAVMGVSIGVQEQVKRYQNTWCDGEKMAAMTRAGELLDIRECIAIGALLVMAKSIQYGLGAVAVGNVVVNGWKWLYDRPYHGEISLCD